MQAGFGFLCFGNVAVVQGKSVNANRCIRGSNDFYRMGFAYNVEKVVFPKLINRVVIFGFFARIDYCKLCELMVTRRNDVFKRIAVDTARSFVIAYFPRADLVGNVFFKVLKAFCGRKSIVAFLYKFLYIGVCKIFVENLLRNVFRLARFVIGKPFV